jgi:hypothetical protein
MGSVNRRIAFTTTMLRRIFPGRWARVLPIELGELRTPVPPDDPD